MNCTKIAEVYVPCWKTVERFDDTYRGKPCNVKDPLACNPKLFEVCSFRGGFYGCTCPPNFSRLPDGRCKVANECFEPGMNDCSADAICIDEPESYRCECKPGYDDLSEDKVRFPGRICKKRSKISACSNRRESGVDCDKNSDCVDTPRGYSCVCRDGYVDVSEYFGRKAGRICRKGQLWFFLL
ncbi:unnamed protein product [Soboliphyme baturini]|uniref:EGF-like domain-containing protein n=1 Tax=Soboliphyme baturini TaxID=241478 RepID=A0A183IMM6_9BILA|nr:unnamed protein product [Soboliphyme baturini]